MVVYLFVFVFSLVIIYLFFEKKNLKGWQMLLGGFIALLFPILLAAFRDIEVGTDLSYYALPIWSDATAWAHKEADLELRWDGIEKSYLWINFVCAKISIDIAFFLFVIQCLIIVPVFIAAIRLRKYVSPVFVMFIYYFTIYNETLNMIRQSLAVSMSLLAFSYLITSKKRVAYSLYFITMLLHGSAIVGLLIPITHLILTKYKLSRKQISFIMVCAFFALGVVVLYAEQLMIFGMSHGLIDVKYMAYTSGEGMFTARLNKSAILYDIIIFVFVFFTYKCNKTNTLLILFLVISLMSVLFDMTGLVTSYLSRMAKYPQIISILTIPYIFKQIQKKQFNGYYAILPYYKILVVIFWFFTYIISNNGETYPYSSKILGI